MESLALVILIMAILTGFIAIFFTTFGTLIILIGSVVYAGLTDFTVIGGKALILLFIFYLCGEVLEYVAVIIGAKKFGASNKAVIGALIGGILGAIAGITFLGIGVLLGAFLGIFLGAFLVELFIQRDLVKSIKAGAGSVAGRVGAIVGKLIIATIMLIIIASKVIGYYTI